MASPDGVSTQTVKLKLLYTFDIDSKDNHLTRWPHPIDVNTCYLDNATQIGVVDLRTCLEAAITASPELTSRADQDFAVYAYDYSEEDTPLVGQGMLSKSLTMQDEGVEQDTEAMVTGKVTKGLMGLLSKNAQPTLEVKLRFKPITIVPGQRQRSGSISSQDGRPAWLQNDNNLSQSQFRPLSPMDTSGLETMQRMLSEGRPPLERTATMAPDSYHHSRPGSRAGTPTLVQNYNLPQQRPSDPYPRPDSTSGMRPQSHARRDSFNSGYFSGEDNADDGPVRKRAKPSKVAWPSKTSFNIERQPDSLRVAASTAQSVRIHRPIAMNPTAMLQGGTLTEEPVRPPTPIPRGKTGRPRGRPRKVATSTLGSIAHTQNPSSSLNMPPQSDAMDTVVSSPEDLRPRSASTTPLNIPSSPPISFEHPGPAVTSPALPPMSLDHDSGFMSGNMEDLFDDKNILQFDDFILEQPQHEGTSLDFGTNDLRTDDQQYAPVFDDGNEGEAPQPAPAPAQALKVPIPPPPPPRPMSRSQSFAPTSRVGVGMSSPKLAPAPFPRARQITEEQRAKERLQLPPLPASEPSGRAGLQRSNTWAPNSDALMSEALAGDDSKQKPKKKVGKEQTRARLESALAAGEMPPYCDNCGSIDTPAWRRGYAKVYENCHWDDIETSLAHGCVCFKEVLACKDDGTINSFRGLKTDKIPGDDHDGWKPINLCNPCGLWFNKQKCPRPEAKWKNKGEGKGKRKRAPKGQKKPPTAKSDAPTPMSDDSSAADTASVPADYYDNDNDNDYDGTINGEDERADSNEPQLPAMSNSMRASSAEAPARGLARARPNYLPATRQVQSSPGRGRGRGSEAEPIVVDLTPKPIRRQLFPSPDKPQIRSDLSALNAAAKTSNDLPHFVRRSPRLNRTKNVFQIPGLAGAVALTADGKENIMPDFAVDPGVDVMYDAMADEQPIPPSTPTPSRRSERLIMKTPSRQFGTETSPNAQRTPTFRTPKPKNGSHPVAAALLGTIKANQDPADMTPFSRMMTETLNGAYELGILNTPELKKASKKSTPAKHLSFDFPDLPSLNNSSPMHGEPIFNINFSELPTDILPSDMHDPFSTDAAVPSSPPGFMSFINSDGYDDIDWDGMPNEAQAQDSVYPDPEASSTAPPSQMLRRSPRKNR